MIDERVGKIMWNMKCDQTDETERFDETELCDESYRMIHERHLKETPTHKRTSSTILANQIIRKLTVTPLWSEPLLGARASSSSKNSKQGAAEAARAKRVRT